MMKKAIIPIYLVILVCLAVGAVYSTAWLKSYSKGKQVILVEDYKVLKGEEFETVTKSTMEPNTVYYIPFKKTSTYQVGTYPSYHSAEQIKMSPNIYAIDKETYGKCSTVGQLLSHSTVIYTSSTSKPSDKTTEEVVQQDGG